MARKRKSKKTQIYASGFCLHRFVEHFILSEWLKSKRPPKIMNNPLVVGDLCFTKKGFDEKKWEIYEKKYFAYLRTLGIKTEDCLFFLRDTVWEKIVEKKDKALHKKLDKTIDEIQQALRPFTREFMNDLERDKFIQEMGFFIANYRAISVIRDDLNRCAYKKNRTIDAIFLIPLLMKAFGTVPRGDDILFKHFCHIVNQHIRSNFKHPQKLSKLIAYLLSMFDLFSPTKCDYKTDHQAVFGYSLDARLFCSKADCLEQRVRLCAKKNKKKRCTSSSCADCDHKELSPFNNICSRNYYTYKNNLRPFKFYEMPSPFKIPLTPKMADGNYKTVLTLGN